METEGALLAGRHAFSGADQDTTLWRLKVPCWRAAMHSLGLTRILHYGD